MEKNTGGKCVVCGGEIVEVIEKEPIQALMGGQHRHGSRGLFHEVSKGYHCSVCGIKYDFLPGSIKK